MFLDLSLVISACDDLRLLSLGWFAENVAENAFTVNHLYFLAKKHTVPPIFHNFVEKPIVSFTFHGSKNTTFPLHFVGKASLRPPYFMETKNTSTVSGVQMENPGETRSWGSKPKKSGFLPRSLTLMSLESSGWERNRSLTFDALINGHVTWDFIILIVHHI